MQVAIKSNTDIARQIAVRVRKLRVSDQRILLEALKKKELLDGARRISREGRKKTRRKIPMSEIVEIVRQVRHAK
ncbi:MAG TPA: hypothetical protein VE978_24050 [Chitinophagales bacterium]|nr:hypothetical protein [Chitinophagales bacterium]